jgi:hypothetical protein
MKLLAKVLQGSTRRLMGLRIFRIDVMSTYISAEGPLATWRVWQRVKRNLLKETQKTLRTAQFK